jgi:hypothetical protein
LFLWELYLVTMLVLESKVGSTVTTTLAKRWGLNSMVEMTDVKSVSTRLAIPKGWTLTPMVSSKGLKLGSTRVRWTGCWIGKMRGARSVALLLEVQKAGMLESRLVSSL